MRDLRSPHRTTVIDWGVYRKCEACFAELGQPCLSLSGYAANSGSGAMVAVEADRPHDGRPLRTGYARA